MKELELPPKPPGLNGAIGGAAGLLNAAIRSLKAFELGLLETAGGGAFAAGAGAGAGGESDCCFGGCEATGGGTGSAAGGAGGGGAGGNGDSFA